MMFDHPLWGRMTWARGSHSDSSRSIYDFDLTRGTVFFFSFVLSKHLKYCRAMDVQLRAPISFLGDCTIMKIKREMKCFRRKKTKDQYVISHTAIYLGSAWHILFCFKRSCSAPVQTVSGLYRTSFPHFWSQSEKRVPLQAAMFFMLHYYTFSST